MKVVFLTECAADGCYKKNLNHKHKNGKQMCQKHEDMYERGEKFKAFYGKTVFKKTAEEKK